MEGSNIDSDESIIAYSDQQSIHDQQVELKDEEQTQPPEPDRLNKTEGVTPELMFTIFGHYKKQCQNLALQHKCQIKWSISAYIVEQVGDCTKQQFGNCLEQLSKKVHSIQIEDLMPLFLKPSQQYRYYRSPHINQLLAAKKIKMMMFRQKLFGFSQVLRKQEIRQQFRNMMKGVQIFSICVKKMRKTIKTGNSWVPQIYKNVKIFMESMMEHLSSFFKDRDLLAMFDQEGKYILVHGNRGKYLMEAKASIKNILESMVCLFIRDTKINGTVLQKYLKKASLYPVHFCKINNHTSLLITKDNILKQLATKSPQFMRLIGLERGEEEAQLANDPSIGFFILPSGSFQSRFDKIREKVKNRNYDINTSNGVKLLRQNFIKQGKKQENAYKELISNIAMAVEQGKFRFQAARPIKKDEPLPVEADDGLEYQIISGKSQEEKLSKTLRRDVLTEKVHMKKRHMIAYNISENKETLAYWQVDKKGTPGAEVTVEQLKKGTYLRGAKKMTDRNEEVRNYLEVLTVL